MIADDSQHLSVLSSTTVKRVRRLPVPGELLVSKGDRVKCDTVVASALIQGGFQSISAAAALGLPPARVTSALTVTAGDTVREGQLLGETRALLGLIRNRLFAPMDGIVDDISDITGQLVLAETPSPLSLSAYLDGYVARIVGDTAVEIEARVSMVQGICGIGGEAFGSLRCLSNTNGTPADAETISQQDSGRILMVPGFLNAEAMRKAAQCGVAGIVAASVSGTALASLTGRPINPAATGNESIDMTVVLTEGFGRLSMAEPTFRILRMLQGKTVSMNGATQVRAGVIRPEIVGPSIESERTDEPISGSVMGVGATVRIVRGAAFGAIGKILNAPAHPQTIASGARTLVFEIGLENGQKVAVPTVNVERVA